MHKCHIKTYEICIKVVYHFSLILTTERGNGEGTIFEDKKNKRWIGQYISGIAEDGKAIRKSVYGKTQKEVLNKLNEVKYQMNNDIYVEKNGIKLVKIMEDIREEKLASNTISGGQYARLKWTINKIKNSKLGEMKIQDITKNDIQEFLNSTKDLSDSYIKKLYEQFVQAYRRAEIKKYITYTTPEGYKCRDNKLFEEKYLKGNMEDEFRKIEREQQNSTRKSSSSVSSADKLLSNRANGTTEYIRLEQADERRKCEYEGNNSRNLFGYRDGQHEFEGKTTPNNIRKYGERISNYEGEITRFRGRVKFEIQKNKMENKVDSILSGIIAISNMVSNPQINNRPKRKIRRYRTLSKQAMKEYAMKQVNSSGFDWFDEEKYEM